MRKLVVYTSGILHLLFQVLCLLEDVGDALFGDLRKPLRGDFNGGRMGDYNLQRLSPRDFEQMIQALAAKVIGLKLVIYGDGPDGGREAAFEGKIPYQRGGEPWDGYLVFQAKFKQKTEGATKDGKWALAQLRSELEDFANPEKGRRNPEYYIFVTNVVLSGVQGKGAKDKFDKLIEKYRDRVPLKGFDVWDYDKLRALLDDNQDIRYSYNAWITPGDVLSEIKEFVKQRTLDFDRIICRYLQREFLGDQYASLKQAGHMGDGLTPLAKVFVDLPASSAQSADLEEQETPGGRLPLGFVSEVLDEGNERLARKAHNSATSVFEYMTGENLSPQAGKFVLIGGPGQGKTTIGQFIAQIYRASILNDVEPSKLSDEVHKALPLVIDTCKDEGIDLPKARRFPVRIELSRFAARLAKESDGSSVLSLLSYIAKQIRDKTDSKISADDMRAWLGRYPWVIIWDGLDEVPASSNRDAVLTALRDFQIDVSEANADILEIATTRPQGYNDEFADMCQERYLLPLSRARALHYGKKLLTARFPANEEKMSDIMGRLEEACEEKTTSRLTKSPLQVTILATLLEQIGRPPQDRWRLFREYYETLYKRETARDIPAARVLNDNKTAIDTLHYRTGLRLHMAAEKTGGTEAMMPEEEFAALVKNYLVSEGHGGKELEELTTDILLAAKERLVFIAGLEVGKVGFEIRSLQEYLASEALMDGRDEVVQNRLRQIAPHSQWRNVFLFAAGKCFAERHHLRDTVESICSELNEDIKTPLLKATLAGSRLALDVLSDGPAVKVPIYRIPLARNALKLLEATPSLVHARLADVYSDALQDLYREELKKHLASRVLGSTLGAWTLLAALVDRGHAWADELADKYWPTNPADGHEIVKSSPFVSSLYSRKLSSIATQLPFSEVLRYESSTYLSHIRNNISAPWLNTALRLYPPHISGKSIAISFRNYDEDTFLNLEYLSVQPCRDFLPLTGVPNPCDNWKPYIAASRFWADPCQDTLAQEMDYLAPLSKEVHGGILLAKFPWIMVYCLSQVRSGSVERVPKNWTGV